MSQNKLKTAVFIDGANFHLMSRSLDITVDYRKLLTYFKKEYNLLRAFYYTIISDDGEFSPIKPLADWLEYNGYTMITKTVVGNKDHSFGNSPKNSMDVNLTLDVIEMCNFVDHIILLSGDSDLVPLIKAVQRRGLQVSVIGTIHNRTSITSDELRRKADNFINLLDLASDLQRTDIPSQEIYEDFDESIMESLEKHSDNK